MKIHLCALIILAGFGLAAPASAQGAAGRFARFTAEGEGFGPPSRIAGPPRIELRATPRQRATTTISSAIGYGLGRIAGTIVRGDAPTTRVEFRDRDRDRIIVLPDGRGYILRR